MKSKIFLILVCLFSLFSFGQEKIQIYTTKAKYLDFYGGYIFSYDENDKAFFLLSGVNEPEVRIFNLSNLALKLKTSYSYPPFYSRKKCISFYLSRKWKYAFIIKQTLIYKDQNDLLQKIKVPTVNAFRKFYNKKVNRKDKLKGVFYEEFAFDDKKFYLRDKNGKIGSIEYEIDTEINWVIMKDCKLEVGLDDSIFEGYRYTCSGGKTKQDVKNDLGKVIVSVEKNNFKKNQVLQIMRKLMCI